MSDKIKVIGSPNTGSAIAEAFLILGGMAFEREEIDYDKPGPKRDYLFRVNPLGQLPTLILENGEILTETLAIANYVQKLRPTAGLIPDRNSIKFWRWVTIINTAIYPTFTYGDDPAKWVAEPLGADQLKKSTDERREMLWMQVESVAGAPFFLGDGFSAIDIYIAVMSHWRPRKPWFETHCPKLTAIAHTIEGDPRFSAVWNYHFKN